MSVDMKLDYGKECRVPLPNGHFLCFESYEANTEGCDYVRIVDMQGNEIAYWNYTEWAEDPKLVMGAIMAAIKTDNHQS